MLRGKRYFKVNVPVAIMSLRKRPGPALGGVLDNEFYGGDIKKIAHWVYNVNSLVNSDPHYAALKQAIWICNDPV